MSSKSNRPSEKYSPTDENYLHQSFGGKELFRPKNIMLVSLTLIIFFILFMVWASYTTVTERITAQGEIQPLRNTISVKHMDGGVIAKVLVFEGDYVKQSQPMMILKGLDIKKEIEREEEKLLHAQLTAEHMRAQLSGKPPRFSKYTKNQKALSDALSLHNNRVKAGKSEKNILEKQLAQKKELYELKLATKKSYLKELKIAKRLFTMHKSLVKSGTISRADYLREERKLIAMERSISKLSYEIKKSLQAIREYQSRIQSHEDASRASANAKLADIDATITDIKKHIEQLTDKAKGLVLRSPVTGVIKFASTSVSGEIIEPGRKAFEIVPQDKPLIATIEVNPNDIAALSKGQTVMLKVSAFDFLKYGMIPGKISHISASTFQSPQKSPYFKAHVVLENNYMTINKERKYLSSGMLVTAEISTRERTIMEYLLKPLYRAMNSSFTEQ